MIDHQVDIVIVGGGLNGAALLRALASTGLQILMLDNQDFFKPHPTQYDDRSLTLSIASMRILQNLGVWASLTATPIQRIHISEQGRFGTACLTGPDEAPLGHVVPITQLVQSLYQELDRDKVWAPATVTDFDPKLRVLTVRRGDAMHKIQAKLVVAADGSHSSMRELCHLPVCIKEYGQHALVTQVHLARTHSQTAYERFTASGPLALLPLAPKRMGVVWSLSPDTAQRLRDTNEQDFLQALIQVFGYRLGRFTGVERRITYPLSQMMMRETVYDDAVVFIGNAAHTLHPVAGQGFNLGLRDVAMLAQMLRPSTLQDPTLLRRYQAARQADQNTTARFSDGLISLYHHSGLGVRAARQLGLLILDNNRLLKRILARYASGLAGLVPDLVCGLSS